MKKIVKYLLIAAVGSFFVGCYNDFEQPGPAKIYQKSDFDAQGLTYISPKALKARFYQETGLTNNGLVASWDVNEPLYTCGKVISNDRPGNVYKSLYLYDGFTKSAIEVRLTNGNYISYPVGQIVYVKLKGLTLGNYRGMVSIGKYSTNVKYSNGNIEEKLMIKEHIFSGDKEGMAVGDTLVVNSTNYSTAISENDLGRLVRFEGVKSQFGKTPWGGSGGSNFPSYLYVDSTDPNNIIAYEGNVTVTTDGWNTFCVPGKATWATSHRHYQTLAGTTYFYGSAWFTYDAAAGAGSNDIPAGNYIVRSSGYSMFRDNLLPGQGQAVNMTAIYTRYCANTTGNYLVYQLVLNSDKDVKY